LVPGDRAPFSVSSELLDMLVEAGSDMVEIAVPTRFPWMEGRAMQLHQLDAMERGIKSEDSFDLMRKSRSKYPNLPLIVINFMGPVFALGLSQYTQQCGQAGMDCADIPDYPYVACGDSHGLVAALRDQHLHFNVDTTTAQAAAPEGSPESDFLAKSVQSSSGFLFMIAQPGGVSGVKDALPVDQLKPAVQKIHELESRLQVDTPVIAVCGISTPEQVHETIRNVGADGVMLGSAVSRRLQAGESLERIQPFVAALKDATRV
jgi:tryptophan synthase alpha chain